MDKTLTDDTLTKEEAMIVAQKAGEQKIAPKKMSDSSGGTEKALDPGLAQASSMANQAIDQAKTMARNVGEQAVSAASNASATAQDLARRALGQTDALYQQASAASDTIYQQGARAGQYLTRNVNEYPLAALLIAGALGYGVAYLIHSSWQAESGD